LTYDRRFKAMDPGDLPALDAPRLRGRLVTWSGRLAPILLLEFRTPDGRRLRLCDHGSAGEGGSPYCSWLPLRAGPIDLPQYFASPRAALDCAAVGRFGCQMRSLRDRERQMREGRITPQQFVGQLASIEQMWPEIAEATAKARARLAADPQDETARRVSDAANRLQSEFGGDASTWINQVRRIKDEAMARYDESRQGGCVRCGRELDAGTERSRVRAGHQSRTGLGRVRRRRALKSQRERPT
jgi:hypothetical protein